MKILFPIFLLSSLGCFKFSGTDVLYSEGKKSKPTLIIQRRWCSQCGCEAIEIKEMVNKNIVTEMLLNCTEGCPPGDKSYKIERQYQGKKLIASKYYYLVGEKYPLRPEPLSVRDSLLIQKLRQFGKEPFFQRYCVHLLYKFKGTIETDSSRIIRFPGK